jgi:hypothetical protein
MICGLIGGFSYIFTIVSLLFINAHFSMCDQNVHPTTPRSFIPPPRTFLLFTWAPTCFFSKKQYFRAEATS